MQEKLAEIKKEYENLHNEMLKKKELLRPTELGYYGSVSADDVFELFRKIRLNMEKSFVDLGSGDGKIVLIADLFTQATGIEVDESLIETSEKMKKKLKIDKAKFIKGDFLVHDISHYDIIFINPDQPMYEIEKKLRQEMKKEAKLVVYGSLYTPLNMKLLQKIEIKGSIFSVFGNQ